MACLMSIHGVTSADIFEHVLFFRSFTEYRHTFARLNCQVTMADHRKSNPFTLHPAKDKILHGQTLSGVPPKMAKTESAATARSLRYSDAIIMKCGPEEIKPETSGIHILPKAAASVNHGSETVTSLRRGVRADYIRKHNASSSSSSSSLAYRKNNPVQKADRLNSLSVNIPQTRSSSSKGDVRDLDPSDSKKHYTGFYSEQLESKQGPADGSIDRSSGQLAVCKDISATNKVLSFKLRSYCPAKDESQKSSSDGTSLSKIASQNQMSKPNGPARKRIWKGSFEIFNNKEDMRFCEGILAHPSAKVSKKAFEFSKQIAGDMMFVMHPRSRVWPKIFELESPDRDDVAIYFYPGHFERSKRQYASLLKFIEKQDLVLRSRMGKVDLLVFPSKLLDASSQQLNGNYFLWGVFSCKKDEVASKKAHISCVPATSQ